MPSLPATMPSWQGGGGSAVPGGVRPARSGGRLFGLNEVVDGITRKLVRRHPMCFRRQSAHPPGTLKLAEAQISERWEQIKAEERAERAGEPRQLSLLDDVPRALPALSRAQKLQKRAAAEGFDWDSVGPVIDKISEELQEVREAIGRRDQEQIGEEIGDLLFAMVNLARHLKVDAETALRGGNEKFERRLRFIETRLREDGKVFAETDLQELDSLWDEAKRQGL